MEPLEVGTHVEYHGSLEDYHGVVYEVTAFYDPVATRPDLVAAKGEEYIRGKYEDGYAYELWPAGADRKWGSRHLSLHSVRRGSITPVEEKVPDPGMPGDQVSLHMMQGTHHDEGISEYECYQPEHRPLGSGAHRQRQRASVSATSHSASQRHPHTAVA